jgi:outer membrane protein OmpA-like peptidoglycan-associated protein
MRSIGLTFILSGVLAAQAPSPVQRGVTQTANGAEPVFHVDVTSRSIRAVNYHNRQGTTKIDLRGTALLPPATGEASVTANTGSTRISLHFDHLSNAAQFGPEYLTYVLWAITPEGRPERLGEVTLKDANAHSAELYVTTDLQTFGMIVTAEPYFGVSQPSDVVVMENILRKDTYGTLETVDAKYELLKRGVYTLNVNANAITPIANDVKVPLQLREARLAVALAKAQGAEKYAPDVMQKVAVNMVNAENFYIGHNQKEVNTNAREATQEAEDARRISIVKEREETEQAERDANTRRMAEAKARADASAADAAAQAELRAQADRQKAEAERQKAEAERQTHEAEIAMNNARTAQQQAEAARLAAVAEQQKLAAAKADAESARGQAEKDAQTLRDRLREQLNLVLQTRDTARGLIVNMSDVLFDFNQATLLPGAKEKLAKVSGILLAYPTLRLKVEGHTDSVGSDDYNMKLSQRRADSVRDYLTTNGIAAAGITSVGLGKADPVASNDTNAGRQQNRRVELVVSGDVIGQPISDATPATPSLQQ